MSENSESKVLYVSEGGNTNSYSSEFNENNHKEYDGGVTSNDTEEYDGGMTNNDSSDYNSGMTNNDTEEYDGGMTNDDLNNNNDSDYDGGMIKNEYDDKISYGGGDDSDNDSIDTCEILKVDPLMIRLNCFLKSQNGETIVEILKDIRDELVKLNKNMIQKTDSNNDE